MPNHVTKVERLDTGVKASCTCGWINCWALADGSAEQSAYEHKKRNQNNA